MTVFLLDASVLVAMAWPRHTAHAQVWHWVREHDRLQWATCPFTEAAFVRIISNPAFSSDALTVQDAISLLNRSLLSPSHHFWADTVSFQDAVHKFQERLVGHQQVSDSYLLGLALHKKGRLATLDRGLHFLAEAVKEPLRAVELIK